MYPSPLPHLVRFSSEVLNELYSVTECNQAGDARQPSSSSLVSVVTQRVVHKFVHTFGTFTHLPVTSHASTTPNPTHVSQTKTAMPSILR